MKFRIVLIFLCIVISACSNKITLPGNYDIQFVPEKAAVEKVDDIKISYVIPSNTLESQGIDGLAFNSNSWGTPTKRETIQARFNSTTMEVERRTDNGVAGFGLIYSVEIDKINKGNDKIITFNSKIAKTYQDGVILPFPLPKFDLASYLLSASVMYKFELTSDYPVNSIKANFDRIVESYGTSYKLQLSDCLAVMEVKIYPYRQGSKVAIIAELSQMKANANIIDVSNKVKELEIRVKTIVGD